MRGCPGSGLTEKGTTPEIWQQPTVVPVDGKYTAQPNDNFYTISRKVYGAGAYFRALAKFNADKYPTASQIRIGDIVQTPPVDTLEGRYPELCPKPEHRDAAKKRSQALAKRSLAGRRIYVVQEGDNLFDIARFELGARARVARADRVESWTFWEIKSTTSRRECGLCCRRQAEARPK